MPDLIVKVLLAYMLGSISGSLVAGAFRHVDIRESGSGNAGGTNALRTQGLGFALFVVVIDVGKGFLSAWLIPGVELAALGQPLSTLLLTLCCGFAAVFGHCYPLWHGFRGGKGAATAIGALIVIQPAALIPMLTIWLLVLVLTGWVGLGTIFAACSLVPVFWWLGANELQMGFAVAIALFITFTHRSNIRHMRDGSEYRFEKVRAANWFRRA